MGKTANFRDEATDCQGYPITIRVSYDPYTGRRITDYVDIRLTDDYARAIGLDGMTGLAYIFGGNEEQVRNPSGFLPEWIRYFANGLVGSSPYSARHCLEHRQG